MLISSRVYERVVAHGSHCHLVQYHEDGVVEGKQVKVDQQMIHGEWQPGDHERAHHQHQHDDTLSLRLDPPPIELIAKVPCQLALSVDDACNFHIQNGGDCDGNEKLCQCGLDR